MIRLIDGASEREETPLSEQERRLLELFRRASAYDRKFALRMLEEIESDMRNKRPSKARPALQLVNKILENEL